MFKKSVKITFVSLFFILLASSVQAGNLQDAFNGEEEAPLNQVGKEAGYDTSQTGVNPIIETIIQVALSFVGVIFLILTIYGGFLWMTASGNEEQIAKAKKTLRTAIIGLLIVMAAYAISWFVINELSEKALDTEENTQSRILTDHYYL